MFSNYINSAKQIVRARAMDSVVFRALYQAFVEPGLVTIKAQGFLVLTTDKDGVYVYSWVAKGEFESSHSVATADELNVWTALLDFDANSPALARSVPVDDAAAVVVSANIVLTFDANVAKDVGNIVIRETLTGEVVASIDVTDALVVVASAVVTITNSLFGPLDAATKYFVEVADGSFKAAAGDQPIVGFQGDATLKFTTA